MGGNGGNGGNGSANAGATSMNGGAAATATGTGSAGGAGGTFFGSGKNGGNGGNGAADASATTGSGPATATASATGGAGGNSGEDILDNGGNGGNGGNAVATASATATGGAATATATAEGGAAGAVAPGGTGVIGVAGKGDATASATTSGGAKAQSLATATGSTATGLSTSETSLSGITAKTVASSSTESASTTNAIAQAGGGGQTLVNPGQSAYAFATALPEKPYSTALIGGASNVAGALLGPREVVLGTSILGASLSGDGSVSNTYSASSTFDFAPKGDLLLGLISPLDGAPTDFQQIDFTVTLNGAEVVDEIFTSLATADAFFADDVINLGSVSGATEIKFAYDLVAGGSGGYGMDLAFGGAVPEPSTWATMLIGFGGLGYAGLRRASKGRSAPKQRLT
jgi:hypothetical protein